MSLRHLGEQIDIHGGGNDLIFPHHENEIAQTESMTGKSFARYWMHNGMLQLAGEKMSKSLGNLITIDDFLNKHSSDALRILIYSGHYRKPVVYNDETLTAAQRVLTRLLTALRPGKGPKTTGEEVDTLREATENARANFITAMDDDFNTSTGMAAIFELVRAINSARDAGVSGPFFSAAQQTLRELTGVLGLTLTEETNEGTGRGDVKPFVDLLVNIRTELRTAKQWALADKVRNGLKEHGVVIEDTPEGPVWRFGE
jgi:cysteinyl-tRNA synthetase